MNVTTVLLENLIQGFQTALWLGLIIMSIPEKGILDLKLIRDNAAVFGSVLLAVCYWLGIVVDSAYYNQFIQGNEKRWAEELGKEGDPSLAEMVFTCMLKRVAICRRFSWSGKPICAWFVSTVNVALITIAACIFVFRQAGERRYFLMFGILVAGGFLYWLTRFAWRKLYRYYFRTVRIAYGVASRHTPHPPPKQFSR